jgi:hypothetical protein
MNNDNFKKLIKIFKFSILIIFFFVGTYYFTGLDITYLENSRVTDVGKSIDLTINYFWKPINSINYSFLLIITMIILVLIIHVIIIYQSGFDNDEHGH